jgi:hypothetical protein
MVQLRDLIVTAPEPLREQLSERMTIRGKASLCRRLRPATGELELPSQSARFALRSLARRSQTLDEEIATLDEQLKRLVRSAAPRTTACSASRPATRDNCSSAPGRTSTACEARARSPRSAAPARSRRPRARPPATVSTTAAATATPTAHST